MFHSYASYLYPVILSPLPNGALLKCIIPKGAYYYKYYNSYSCKFINFFHISSNILICELA